MTAERAGAPAASEASSSVRRLGWLYVVGGGGGLAAAIALILEKLATLANPDHVPTCTLTPVVSCGSVMDSAQATAFGFPNPLLGIGGFAVVVTVGVVLLCGFRPPRWFWLGMQTGTTFGVGFVHWLIYSSLYDIGALCPYCMVVWVVTIPIFWYTTLHNLTSGHLTPGGRPVALVLARYHTVVLTLWYLAIVVLVFEAFWFYWRTLL
ncbi:putative membrane protein [Prauserella sediminis]|uniref:Putative membrane protein n=1 Tax=Prauserella sediminis TaxID=577680 RepID=A0A839XLW1_9PSEU|nr:vitamin K epoxide reductase family protein [Prauserella sediminis]MBB3663617.1 putative membrane protein [Prauserella sediminis]